jgi:hypothetical protein
MKEQTGNSLLLFSFHFLYVTLFAGPAVAGQPDSSLSIWTLVKHFMTPEMPSYPHQGASQGRFAETQTYIT